MLIYNKYNSFVHAPNTINNLRLLIYKQRSQTTLINKLIEHDARVSTVKSTGIYNYLKCKCM